jgi:PIN domain nuclease of toxin-antitoxin system
VVASVAAIWELEIKRAIDRLRFAVALVSELGRVGADVLPITAADATSAARLPLHHRDPVFDKYGLETLAA